MSSEQRSIEEITAAIERMVQEITSPFIGMRNDEATRQMLYDTTVRGVQQMVGPNATVGIDWARSTGDTVSVPITITMDQPTWTYTGRTFDDMIAETATAPPRRNLFEEWGINPKSLYYTRKPTVKDNEDGIGRLKSMEDYY